MNIFEIELERMQKRVKKLEESLATDPDPRKLKTNKLLYELDIDARKAQLEAYREGKPFTGAGGMSGGLLAQAMGFVPGDGIMMAVTNIPQGEALKYFDEVRAKGMVADCCDMSVMVYSQMDHVERPRGRVAIIAQKPCTVQGLASLYRTYTGYAIASDETAYFHLDIPFEESEAALEHVTNQLRDYIELCEKLVPGVKYDEDKLAELQHYDDEAHGYYKEIYEMLKHRPCPLAGRDAFWQTVPNVPGIFPNPAKGVEYAKARRDEVAERIEKGIAAVPGEKARVMWTVTRPFFMDNFEVLEKWGIIVPVFYAGPTHLNVPMPENRYWGNRELSPLEREAAAMSNHLWSGTGAKWVDPMIWIARDLGVQGIVNYCQRGATCTLGLKKLVEDRAEKELGIPVLQLEGAQYDSTYASEATITAKLDEYAELVLSQLDEY